MSNNKNIFEVFKNKSRRLESRPSPEAWNKLHHKLEARRLQRDRRFALKQYSVAAAIIGAIGIFTALFLMNLNSNQQNTAMSDSKASQQLVCLSCDWDAGAGETQFVKFQQKHRNQLEKGVPENKRFSSLLANKKVNRAPGLIAEANKIEQETRSEEEGIDGDGIVDVPSMDFSTDEIEPIAMVDKKPPPKEKSIKPNNAYKPVPEVATGTVRKAPKETTVPGAPPPPKLKDMELDSEVIAETKLDRTKEMEDLLTGTEASEGKADSRKERMKKEYSNETDLPQLPKKSGNKPKRNRSLNAAKNSISVRADEQPGLDQFNWLLGKWQKKNKEGKSLEEWKYMDEFHIEGKGMLIVNGDTTFTENIRLEKTGEDLYYIFAVESGGNPVKYKLKTYTNKRAVFENTAISFPNQVVLQRRGNQLTTTLQNNIPAPVNGYLQNRNQVKDEKAARTLKKIN